MSSIWTEMMGLDLRQTYYNAGGIRTRVLEAGAGKPLILLHGTGGHAEAYTRNIAAHAKHFHVYAADMVGHGFTATPDIDYSYEDYVDWLLAFMDAIKADKAMISGESLGAVIAQLLSVRHPDRVDKIVLNTGILWPPSDEGRKALLDFVERSRAAASAALTPELVRKRLEWLMADPAKSVTEELVAARYKIYSQPGRGPVLRKIANQSISTLLADDFAKKYCAPDFLARTQCPTLAVWTRHNPGQPLDVAEAGLKFLPHAKLIILEKSAHWPQWEEADAFNEAHIAFLTGNAAGKRG